MRRAPKQDQAERIATFPSGSNLRLLASALDAIAEHDPSSRAFTLADGSIAVYILRRYRSW